MWYQPVVINATVKQQRWFLCRQFFLTFLLSSCLIQYYCWWYIGQKNIKIFDTQ